MKAREVTLALLAARAADATVCPSEVARVIACTRGAQAAAADWRSALPDVHAAVDDLLVEGRVELSWKGTVLDARSGPYRIGRGPRSRC